MTTSCTGWVFMTMTQKQWGHLTNPRTTPQYLQGSHAPKTRLHGCLEHHSFPTVLSFFPMQAVTPLVSSTRILLLLLNSKHQPSLHPPIPRYRTTSLTPFLEDIAFVCAWQAHSTHQSSRCGSLAKELVVHINAAWLHQTDNIYNFGSLKY